jgi:cytochrome c peroxidase
VLLSAVALGGLLAIVLSRESHTADMRWTAKERRVIQRLSLASLPPVPRDPSNRVADDPRAAELGHSLFFDKGLSSNGRVACASCHVPQRGFQDGRRVGKALSLTDRRTMPLAGAAYATWLFWDGRRDSLWAQALTPLESKVEHGITRTFAAGRIATRHRRAYEAVFGRLPREVIGGALPEQAGPLGSAGERRAWHRLTSGQRRAVDEMFANLGKAIAAYERRLLPAAGRFDRFADALATGNAGAANRLLTRAEARGLRLSSDRRIARTATGPLFTNGQFHNTGVPQTGPALDSGRESGVRLVLKDPFNCLGRFSDACPDRCTALRFLVTDGGRLSGSFKVPPLRGVGARAPYMHEGQFATLRDVLEHYRRAPAARVGVSELDPLQLSDRQLGDIEAFLGTLDGGVAAPKGFLLPPGAGS